LFIKVEYKSKKIKNTGYFVSLLTAFKVNAVKGEGIQKIFVY